MQHSLPTSLAARVERLERELRLARKKAASAELVQLLEVLAECAAIQRRAVELAAELASRAESLSLKIALVRLSLFQGRFCELVASLAGPSAGNGAADLPGAPNL